VAYGGALFENDRRRNFYLDIRRLHCTRNPGPAGRDNQCQNGEYASSAILYNVVRASKAEPLNFVSLAAVTGHQTATAGIGLPTIIVGPGRTATQNLFLFGPNSIGGSEASDFNVGVIDDPASYAALLRPTDPATLGFLLSQSYDPAMLFFLFVSSIEIDNGRGSSTVYTNDPYVEVSDDDVNDQRACAEKAGCVSACNFDPLSRGIGVQN
jgi:hypothetical protein